MNTNPGRIDRYELQTLLGQGNIAEVWKAFDTSAHRYVAIKFLRANLQIDPDFVTRFQREMPAIAALHHPGIVQYHDFSILQPAETGNVTAYVVMDYVDGSTLADYTRNTSRLGKFLPTADIVRLFTTIGMAVDYAHQHGMVHGQLKPTNILLDKHNSSRNAMGEPVVTDFGMLKLLGVAAGNTSGWQIDTLLYTSPEQIMGAPANERSDLYSLGVMLYEICTGTPPFRGTNPATIMMQHTSTIAALPALINPGLSFALTTIIMRCIAKDPWARFPTVSSLVEALTEAVGQEEKEVSTLSVPMNVARPDYPVNALDMPTILTGPPSTPPGMMPATLTPSAYSGASFSPLSRLPLSAMTPGSPGKEGQVDASNFTPTSSGSVGSSLPVPAVRPGEPTAPISSTAQPAESLPVGSYAPPPTPTPPAYRKSRRPLLWIALVALLLLVVVGSSLGTYFAFFSKGTAPTTPTASSIVGHAYFISSGLLSSNPGSSQGITDQLQIKLGNIPPPQSGKAYYAWLLNDINLDAKAIPLGQLTVNNGTEVLSFGGDASHTNLLATNSRFLITEEDSAAPPVSPSLDPTTYRYYAGFSQKRPNPQDPTSYSLYDHIRHLLASDPKVAAAGLTGGLDIWLYRNTQKILEWAGSARDAWKDKNAAFIQRQLTRIIDYLDGSTYARQDLPGQKLLADPTIAKIGLLTFDPVTQDPPGYLYHIDKHLREIIALPETSTGQRALAIQINSAINAVAALFEAMRTDVLQLYHMTTAQLLGSNSRSLLDTVATFANDAFVGQINSQAQVTEGVVQIHYEIQQMATFDVRACTATNPCSI
ncbi:MAG: serine/threonine-protein kinase [Ktedonobacteraceae bacterium]